MKIICYSDTHGQAPGSHDHQDAIAILHGGDFYDGRILRYAAGREACDEGIAELRRVTDLRWLEQAKLPIYAVKGNHDVADPLGVFSRAQDITGRVVELAPNLLLAGIGWSRQYFFDLPRESDLDAVCEKVRRDLARRASSDAALILLTHYPGSFPELFSNRGVQPTWWYQTIRKFVYERNPMLVVQGHLHEHFDTSAIIDTGDRSCPIVNPGPRGAKVEIDLASSKHTAILQTPRL